MADFKAPDETRAAHTKTTLHYDGEFERTALVIDGPEAGSIDVLDGNGNRLAQINIFYTADESGSLIVDVIDVDKRFASRKALVFSNRERKILEVPDGGNLVSTDFRGEK